MKLDPAAWERGHTDRSTGRPKRCPDPWWLHNRDDDPLPVTRARERNWRDSYEAGYAAQPQKETR